MKCKYCERTFDNSRACKCHEARCKNSPFIDEYNKKLHLTFVNGKQKQVKTYEERTCEFCKKVWKTTAGPYMLHVRTCKQNPNRMMGPFTGKHHSKDTLEKISEGLKEKGCGGWRGHTNGGRGHKGWYKGLYCASSWELAWVVYNLDNGLLVKQCRDHFKYEMNGITHQYTPDFIIDDVYYEIKGWHRPDTDFKISQFPKDKKLILIEGFDENDKYIKYAENRYGKRFWEKLYE